MVMGSFPGQGTNLGSRNFSSSSHCTHSSEKCSVVSSFILFFCMFILKSERNSFSKKKTISFSLRLFQTGFSCKNIKEMIQTSRKCQRRIFCCCWKREKRKHRNKMKFHFKTVEEMQQALIKLRKVTGEKRHGSKKWRINY